MDQLHRHTGHEGDACRSAMQLHGLTRDGSRRFRKYYKRLPSTQNVRALRQQHLRIVIRNVVGGADNATEKRIVPQRSLDDTVAMLDLGKNLNHVDQGRMIGDNDQTPTY